MPTESLVLILALIAVVISVASWWGVRRLRAQQPAPAGPAAGPVPTPRIQKVALVINPVKNQSGRALELLRAACRAARLDPPLIFETRIDDPGHSMAREAIAAGADVVIAGGGDGTVRVVAQALAGTDVVLGLLPLGTGNLLARNLGLDVNDLAGNVHAALHGPQRRIDTGTIKLENSETGHNSTHTFLVIAGIGLDAEVIADTQDVLKRKFGWLAYGEAGVRNLPGKRKRLNISLDDGPVQTRKIRSVLFANCGLLPGGIDFIPEAKVDDGFLDVVVMSPRSAAGWIWIAGKTVFKHRGSIPVIDYYRARKVRISAPEPTGTQLDGDLSGEVTALTVEVRPGALLIRAPASVV